MSNSSLVSYERISPHKNKRQQSRYYCTIDTITIHCMAGNMTAKACCDYFATTGKEVSSNYTIGSDGSVGLSVPEDYRSWCTSDRANDYRAITIEVANDGGADTGWHVSDTAMSALIELVADVCRRNGITKLTWSKSKAERVNHVNGCNMTVHRDYANKTCPGDFLYNRMEYIAEQVNAKIGAIATTPTPEPVDDELYRVRKTWEDVKSQIGAYRIFDNAKSACRAGYSVFNFKGEVVYTSSLPTPTPAPQEPEKKEDIVYTIKKGDTLGKIAKKYGTTVKTLQKYNNIKNADLIIIGQKIKIPQ